MTPEEKAKAYDEALEQLKGLIESTREDKYAIVEEDIIGIFPELAESEGGKIKRILHSISSKMSFHLHNIFTEEEFQCFDAWSNAWLKKQGEQPQGKTALEAVKEISPTEFLQQNHLVYHQRNMRRLSINECIDGSNNEQASSVNIGKIEKPKWSDEDDYYRDNLITWLNCGAVRVDLRKDFINWLESLKQRMEQ